MACPFFYPTARLETSSWVIPPRLPLGDAYAGECRAAAIAFQPEEQVVRGVCNSGYGRGCCQRFPDESERDAVRFHVAGDAGDLIRIQYVFEKACWPASNGVVEFSIASHQLCSLTEDAILKRQAEAFAESYVRRRD